MEIVDIAGLVKGQKGEGLGNKFLANIRETDAILHALRCFDDENVTHVDGSVDPVRDKEIDDTELTQGPETIEAASEGAETGADRGLLAAFQADRMRCLVRYREWRCCRQIGTHRAVWNEGRMKIAHELFLLTEAGDVCVQRGWSQRRKRQQVRGAGAWGGERVTVLNPD